MSISSQSTDEQINAAYDDNADYAEVGSIVKARTFVLACRIMLRRTPQQAGSDGQYVGRNLLVLQSEMNRALDWLASAVDLSEGGSAGVIHPNLRDFR